LIAVGNFNWLNLIQVCSYLGI